MSRYISVLGLAARSCFLKGLAIMVVSVLLSGLLLYLLPEGVERESYMDENGEVQWIYEAYDLSEIPEVSRAAAPWRWGLGCCVPSWPVPAAARAQRPPTPWGGCG